MRLSLGALTFIVAAPAAVAFSNTNIPVSSTRNNYVVGTTTTTTSSSLFASTLEKSETTSPPTRVAPSAGWVPEWENRPGLTPSEFMESDMSKPDLSGMWECPLTRWDSEGYVPCPFRRPKVSKHPPPIPVTSLGEEGGGTFKEYRADPFLM